ncbi:MAG: MBL fold metallo-hydrolase [Patescibacteria group bacterium]|nr:MBL fold metallo-hydrolase [Patescibacteria group bacterium]MDE1988726.1 MBL fold metallo-hydrolase [Patescibacteria group bacterium]MDE2218094.1 MBL fold metallo-hydrolase [Patescibacteria group bacterium]
MKKLNLTFYGGVDGVTGANFMLEKKSFALGDGGVRILVDCGMVQGSKFAENFNRSEFKYNPSSVDYLLVTHSHIDHIGRIPKLVHDGFKGEIISTPETKDLSRLMLEDSLKILEEEARQDGLLPLYEKKDVEKSLSLWNVLSYHAAQELKGGFNIYFKDAGHILGSAMIEISYNGKKIVFTGDLGNSPSPLLRDTESVAGADYMVMESVYGDRNHESKEERKEKLKDFIKKTLEKKATLIIPAFSLERTQAILHEMNDIFENGGVASLPVFIDSPLAAKVTEVYKKYAAADFNDAVKAEMAEGDDVFDFPRLKFTARAEESDVIRRTPNPKIIIAGSGMSHGGRIVRHEKNYLSDPNAILLLVGYQAVGSLGRQLEDGARKVSIFGDTVNVRAKIEKINGYSSHKDSDNLVGFVGSVAALGEIKKIFVVMGELKSSLFLVQRIRDELGAEAVHPKGDSVVELNF